MSRLSGEVNLNLLGAFERYVGCTRSFGGRAVCRSMGDAARSAEPSSGESIKVLSNMERLPAIWLHASNAKRVSINMERLKNLQ